MDNNNKPFDNQTSIAYTVLGIGVAMMFLIGGFLIYLANHIQ